MHRAPPLPRLPVLLPLSALLLVGACANGFEVMDPQPITSVSPLELTGRQVLSSTGRNIGEVGDVVFGMDRRPEQIIVAVGAPMTMQRRHVAVNVDEGRLSTPQNAIVLNGDLSPEQVASRPDVGADASMVALGRLPTVATVPTNWSRATMPGP